MTHVFEALVRAEPSAVIAACDTVREMLANPASAVGGTSTPPSRQDWAASLRLASSPVRPSPLRAPANQSPRSEAWWRRNVDGKSRQEIARVACRGAAQRRADLAAESRLDDQRAAAEEAGAQGQGHGLGRERAEDAFRGDRGDRQGARGAGRAQRQR